MRQYLSAQQVQAASQIALSEVVDEATLRNIKARDPHPEIRLYSIGHEGEANLHLPGIGKKTITWVQAAVRLIADKLEIGTAVFNRHNPDTNSHKGREQIGEVVGKTLRKIGDRLNTLAAIHIYDKFKSRPLDIASFEAEIEYDHDDYQAWPSDIISVSGIALSNSGVDNPAFAGATLLGAVQAFVQAFEGEFGDKKMNKSDVLQGVKELGLKPSQVFDIGDIMSDSAVAVKVKDGVADLTQKSDRLLRERDEAKGQVVKLENTNAETSKKLQQHTMLSKSATVLDTILADPERKLGDKARMFVKRSLKTFSTTAEDEDALNADIGKFVDGAVKEYGELAKDVFGIETDKQTPNNPIVFKLPPSLTVDGQKAPNTSLSPPSIPAPREETLKAEMNPDLNPLIPGGKAALEAQKTQ